MSVDTAADAFSTFEDTDAVTLALEEECCVQSGDAPANDTDVEVWITEQLVNGT